MLDLYDMAVSIIGQVPVQLTWLYSFGTIVLLGIVVLGIVAPFVAMLMLIKQI